MTKDKKAEHLTVGKMLSLFRLVYAVPASAAASEAFCGKEEQQASALCFFKEKSEQAIQSLLRRGADKRT